MDKKDIILLRELLHNSRIAITSIAKKAGISREVALYRINNLNKEVIRGYYTTIDLNSLGFKRYGCLMQFTKIDILQEEELIRKISMHPFVTFVGPQISKWNVAFDIQANNEEHLEKVLKELKSYAGIHLDSFLITRPGTNYNYFPFKYLGEKEPIQKQKKKSTITVDEIDKKILSILAKNSRAEYLEIAKITKLSANAIKYRIKNMENSGIIQGYTISVDYAKLGYQFFNIQLKLITPEDRKLMTYASAYPNIIYYYTYVGQENWDVDFGVIAKDMDELRKVIIDIKKDLGSYIKIYNIMINTSIVKDDIAPDGIFL